MIIIKRVKGGLANRLFAYAQHLTFALENKIDIKWNIPEDTAKYFLKFDKGCIFNKLRFNFNNLKILVLIFLAKLGLRKDVKFLNVGFEGTHVDSEFMDYAHNKTLILDTGLCGVFNFYSKDNDVRSNFELNSHYKKELEKIIAEFREEAEIIVGVHVRHGDYKRWLGGKYYLETSEYGTYMARLKELLPNKNLLFVVCTDDKKMRIEDFNQKELNIKINRKNEILDLYLLSKCNYIIGAVSTYCRWASFIGDVKRFEISKETSIPMSLDEFKIYRDPRD